MTSSTCGPAIITSSPAPAQQQYLRMDVAQVCDEKTGHTRQTHMSMWNSPSLWSFLLPVVLAVKRKGFVSVMNDPQSVIPQT